MDPNNPSNHDQLDVKPAYIKRIDDDMDRPDFDMDRPDFDMDRPDFDMDRPDFDMDLLLKKNSVCDMARNGKHRDDDDDEYDYTDIGPETDVDAGEDVHDNNYPPHAASSSLDPSPESEKSSVETEKHNDDDRNDNDYSNRDNANVCPVDSVVDDADVDNRVRPSDRDVRGADDETLRDNGDDDARVETAGTHTVVDDDESPPSPRTTKPLQHELIVADNVADSEDSEDGWDYYRGDPKNQQSAAVAADESREEVEKQSAEESPREEVVEQSAEENPCEEIEKQSAEESPREEVEKQSAEESPREEVEEQRAEENFFKIDPKNIKFPDIKDIDFGAPLHIRFPDPCCLDTSDESKSFESDQSLENVQEEKTEQDMDFQLNPEAAEFVPLSPPLLGNNRGLQDFPISGSPLKQTQAMDDIPVPSQSEFDKEVCYRPKEIGEDFSHDEHADLQNNSQSMDISEISSTKAEMGDDESMFTVMSTSQWPTDICSQWNEKTREDSESDLEIDTVTSHNPMTMSLTPGNFEAAFEKNVDLNAVHILDDSSDGAEHVSTPPRSPQPDANEDCACTPPSEDKNSNDVLRASTPQLPDENSVSTVTSENISETKDSSLSATMDENEHSITESDTSFESTFNPATLKLSCHTSRIEDIEEEYALYPEKLAERKRRMLFKNESEDINIMDRTERNRHYILMEMEAQLQNYSQMIKKKNIESKMQKDRLDSTNHSDFNDAMHVSEQHTSDQQSLSEEEVHSETASDTKQTHYSQMTEKENIESEMPKDLDSTNHSDFNDAVHVSEQHTSDQQSLLSQKVHSETASDTKKTHYYAEFDHKIIPDKLDIFTTESLKTENSQSNDSTDYYKTEKLMLETANDPRPYCDFTLDPKEIEQFKKDEDNSNENDDNTKPESKTELNPSDAIQESTLMKNELQNKIETFVENVPTETLIDEQTEQEQTEKKAAELAPTNESFKEKIASENIPMKELETEPQKIIEAAPEDSAMIDKSKEEGTGIVEATVGAAVIGTVTAVAMTSPMKVKTTTTTSAKRPTKTATSKATTASTTKTATKSTPTSPSKAISATMRTTTTSSATQLTTKKPATSTATRPKQLDGSTKAAISSTSGKTTITKTTTVATKAATTTATRTSSSPRVSSGTMRPKTSTTPSKLNTSGTPIEKKSTMSGDAKSVSKPAAKPASASLKPTTTSTTTKTTLVKTSASNITSKPRPASATSAAKTTSTSKLPATGVNGASRPKTAPTSGGTTKPRESRTITATTAKSPLIDKQSKETVNKQISRSGASAPKTTGRVSASIGTATGAATGTATKTRALSTGKSSGNASAISPTKKSTPASKTTPRTPSSATKRTSLSETKVLQNGIPKEDVTKAAVITATSKPEDDVPRKDASPVNVPTDNQLIAD